MDPTYQLLAQIDLLRGNLERAKRTLDNDEINQILLESISLHLKSKIKEYAKDLDTMRTSIDEYAGREAVVRAWRDFSKTRNEANSLLAECLVFLEGSWLRSCELEGSRLDGGLCQIADSLIAHISKLTGVPWLGFSILGPHAYYSGLSNIIRLPFPETSVWNLAVAAHEFGHFVVKQNDADCQALFSDILFDEGENPIITLATEDNQDSEKKNEREILMEIKRLILEEQFADLFATYTMGPAYVCAAIILQFDPRRAYWHSPYHPSDAERVYWLYESMKKADEHKNYSQSVIKRLADIWDSGVADADLSQKTVDKEKLDNRLESIFTLMEPFKLARYNNWYKACKEIAPKLKNDETASKLVRNGDQQLDIRDIVNAAWSLRLSEEEIYLGQVSYQAISLCNELIDG